MYTPVPTSSGLIHLVCKYPVLLLVICITAGATTLYVSPEEQQCNQSFVSFTFDDGYASTYAVAYPILEQYSYTGTIYTPTDFIDSPGYVTMFQLHDLETNGWEIGSHGVSHVGLTTLSYGDAAYEVLQSKSILSREGFKVTSLSTPYGESITPFIDIVEPNYLAVRNAKDRAWILNKIPTTDPYDIEATVVTADTPVEEVERAILEAKDNNKWLVLVFHDIDGSGKYSYPADKFEEIVKFTRDNDFICASELT
jgi:peptidoglycan/xylan/chitin deacetylase (PgdA/CDA1 family)